MWSEYDESAVIFIRGSSYLVSFHTNDDRPTNQWESTKRIQRVVEIQRIVKFVEKNRFFVDISAFFWQFRIGKTKISAIPRKKIIKSAVPTRIRWISLRISMNKICWFVDKFPNQYLFVDFAFETTNKYFSTRNIFLEPPSQFFTSVAQNFE